MRYLELRRHSIRHKPGKHLTQEGVTLARRTGEHLGPFARVVTSTVPRALETAIAMGFAVDEEVDGFSQMGDDVDAAVDWQTGCAGFARAAAKGGPVARYAREQARLLRAIAQALPDGGTALIVSHGGIVEAGAVGCLPDFDFSAWRDSCSYCEGIRLSFDGRDFVDAVFLRAAPAGR